MNKSTCTTLLIETVSVLFFIIHSANSNLNLFLNHIEVRKLLGLSNDLYYVHDGIVNNYALNFSVPVSANITELHFSWQSLKAPLPYSIAVRVSDPKAISNPSLNITNVGNIPTRVETFAVYLPCTGLISAEVDVEIKISIFNFSDPVRGNTTRLNFKRKKICLIGVKQLENDKEQVEKTVVDEISFKEDSKTLIVIFGIICALTSFVLIFIALIALYYRNAKLKQRNQDILNNDIESGDGSNSSAKGTSPVPVVNCSDSNSSSGIYQPPYTLLDTCDKGQKADLQLKDIRTIPRFRIRLKNELLCGTFGKVYCASYKSEEGSIEKEVLVKTVTDYVADNQLHTFLAEGMSLFRQSHENILPVLYVSLDNPSPPYLIYPNQGLKNLKTYLKSSMRGAEGAITLSTVQVVDIALQITRGMQYLHNKHVLHRDLATRNCMITNKLRVQITDNALSRDLFPDDYHCLGDNENRPIKWLPVESIVNGKYSPASDVWSFGVLLWELTSYAQQPYAEIDPFEMAEYIKDGYRLVQPINCPDELYSIMSVCWALNEHDRPQKFSYLFSYLQNFYNDLDKYV